MSPISSRNNVPPFACSNRPSRTVLAPVNAPFSWPNNSDSIKSFGIAAMLRAIKLLSLRGLCLCRALATSSLPVPDCPLIKTLILDEDNRPIARKTSCIAGASPMISGAGVCLLADFLARFVCSKLCSIARLINPSASSISKGLGKYSNAPL